MDVVLVSVRGREISLSRPDARVLATTLVLRDGEAGQLLGFRLRGHLAGGGDERLEVTEEHDENSLLLALAVVERDGFLTSALDALRLAVHGTRPRVS